MFAWGSKLDTLRFDWITSQRTFPGVYPGGMVTTVQSANGVTLNGIQIAEPFPTGTMEAKNIILFSHKATITNNAFIADNIRMARWAIKTDGQPLRDMVPALDPTGAPCMFDIISQEPFHNDGTGDFIYPNMETQATTYSLRNRIYAKMTEHGIRRLYHVPMGCLLSKEEFAEQNGFKLLVETPAPEEGYWTPIWHDCADYIELEWVETAPPEELITE